MNKKNYLVVDFEFTVYTKNIGRPRGFFSEIIEYGATKIDHSNYAELARIQNFVRPEFFPKQAKQSYDFVMMRDTDIAKSISFAEMMAEFKKVYVPNETYFVAWGDADWLVLDKASERYKVENPILFSDYLDLAKAYKEHFKLSHTASLRKAVEETCTQMDGLWHTALDDAINTSKVLIKMLELGWTPQE